MSVGKTTKAIELINAISVPELQSYVNKSEKIQDLMKIFCTKRIKSQTALLRRLMKDGIDISKYHKDLPFIGKTNGELKIYDGYYEYKNDKVQIYYKSKCKCGNEKLILSNHIKSTLDCGCVKSGELIGKKFGKLTVLKPEDKGFVYYIFSCDCGKAEHRANIKDVLRKKITSCGCTNRLRGKYNPQFKGIGDISATHWHSILHSARDRGIDVKVTLEDAWNLFVEQKGVCALTGLEIKFADVTKNLSERTASLDRIDSNKDYELGNIQWVHKTVNTMKMSASDSDFIEFCRLISNRHPNTVVVNSGFYNCLHGGHLKCFIESRRYGNKLVAIVNNDIQVDIKGSCKFISENERLEIVSALKCVDEAILSIDNDITITESLKFLAKKYKHSKIVLAKGGDRRGPDCMPSSELDVCKEYNIDIIYGVGGNNKFNSSSEILKNVGFTKEIYQSNLSQKQLDAILL